MQLFAVYASRQQARLQRNRQHDALAKRAVGRHEHRALRQPRMRFDLGGVLVRQAQAVQLERRPLHAARPFIGIHAGAAAARIARHRMHNHRIVGGHQPRLDQGAQQGDGARGVAAGVADPLGLRDHVGLPRAHLRKPVHPTRRGAMRRTGVDDAHRRVHHRRRRLARRLVRQAQDGHVTGVDGVGTALRILAFGLGQRQQAQVGTAVQTFMNLQAGGALVAVNKD
ncbi:hypothetical protein D3C87_1493680 [compost metagenome]